MPPRRKIKDHKTMTDLHQTKKTSILETNTRRMACCLCGNLIFIDTWTNVSNTSGRVDNYKVVACAGCGLMVTSPPPKGDMVDQAYSSGVYARAGGRLGVMLDGFLSMLHRSRLRLLQRVTKGRFILDVGCGKGRFVSVAGKQGWVSVGYEQSKSQADSARDSFNINVVSGISLTNEVGGQRFDAITSWHVLEHVPDPRTFVQEMVALLKPEGVLVLEVPNVTSWQARIGRGLWFHADIPRHLHHFRLDDLRAILNAQNLTILKTRTSSLELGAFGMLQTMLNRVGFPPNLLFRWLKRVEPTWSLICITNLIVAVVLTPLALLLELLAVTVGKGGVLLVVAAKRDPN